MAETPKLIGEFVKVIDNNGKIRLPRTITEAVQMPDGSSLQDYIDSLEERLKSGGGDVDLESILEIIEKLEELEKNKQDKESEDLITTEKTVIGAINELDVRMDETIICDDSVIYDPSSALFARVRALEDLAKSFVISNESDEVPSLELQEFYEELNKDTFGLSQEERITRLENLFNFYITWELD